MNNLECSDNLDEMDKVLEGHSSGVLGPISVSLAGMVSPFQQAILGHQ